MNTKDEIQNQILIAISSFNKIEDLIFEIPENEGYQCAFLCNIIDMKSRLNQFLRMYFKKYDLEKI